MTRARIILLGSIGVATAYLAVEAWAISPPAQPTAQASVAMLRVYQATGSRALGECGFQCRYSPTCSHYAVAAIAHYGTIPGWGRAMARLWRCSPWGGAGYDPAVPFQEETPEERKLRLEAEKKEIEKSQKEFQEAMQKLRKEAPQAAGEAAAGCGWACLQGAACFIVPGGWTILAVVLLLWVLNDAKARGDQNQVLWVLVTIFVPVAGFIVYLVARPQGNLTPCESCRKNRLPALPKCPHCGAEGGGGKAAT